MREVTLDWPGTYYVLATGLQPSKNHIHPSFVSTALLPFVLPVSARVLQSSAVSQVGTRGTADVATVLKTDFGQALTAKVQQVQGPMFWLRFKQP